MQLTTEQLATGALASSISEAISRASRCGDYPGKRALDVGIALLVLVLGAPVLLLIWLAVRLTSPGPGLHWSRRYGRDGRVFWMPKFRTMRRDAPLAPREALDSAHVTPLGHFLRKSSLDETPQFWSVLCGEMSLVGPRPLIVQDRETHALRLAAGIYVARPGLTGLAQLAGRNHVRPADKVALDSAYIAEMNLCGDLLIGLRTLIVLAKPSGIL